MWRASGACGRWASRSPGGRGVRVMTGVWFELILVLVLVLLNAAFAGSEVALISLREGQLKRLELESGPGRLPGLRRRGGLARPSADRPARVPRRRRGGGRGRAGHRGADVRHPGRGRAGPQTDRAATPRALGQARRPPLAWVTSTTRPAVWLLTRTTDLLVRLAGGDPAVQREAITEEEVRDLVATPGRFRPEQRTILEGAFE